jgi:hypothetical protein
MNASSNSYTGFLATLGWTLAGGIALVCATVVLVDPYGLYDVVRYSGVNQVKPGLTRYQEAIKLTHAAALRPQTVILGNSRAEIGFDPESPVLQHAGGPVYNLAIPGTGLRSSSAELAHLHALGIEPRQVIVGLEFLDFVVSAEAPPAPLSAMSLEPHPMTGTFWRVDTLFSLTSLKDALRTLRIQHDGEAATMTGRGFNPLLEYRAHVRHDGYHKLFRQAALVSLNKVRSKGEPAVSQADFGYLRAILSMSAGSGADVRLLIYPYHAQVLAMFEQTGLWLSFEQWKQQIIGHVAAVRREYPQARITLVDFSGFGAYQCEPIPQPGERQTTRWYWEGGHFKKELGEHVLSRLLAARLDDAAAPFGTVLEHASFEANRQRIAAERSACAGAYPSLFNEMAQMVRQSD